LCAPGRRRYGYELTSIKNGKIFVIAGSAYRLDDMPQRRFALVFSAALPGAEIAKK
jgi:hypothetical protein